MAVPLSPLNKGESTEYTNIFRYGSVVAIYAPITDRGREYRIQNTEFIFNFQYTDIVQYNTMNVFITDNTYYYS